MPFLGSQPIDQYQSLAKQTITGDGSTAYTLNRSVTNAYDMEVFINNVRQEPDTSYTASGNTITFTAAVTASDSCYLIYQGQSVGSINPPANSVGTNQVQNNSITTSHMHTGFTLPAQSSALDITTTTHANASVFKSTGNSQLFLQDTDASLNAKFWGFQNSNSEFNILTCNDDRASAFVTPFTMKQSGAISTPLQPLAVAYYTAATQDGAYGAGSSNRNMITCKPGGTYHNVGNMYDSSTGRYTVTEPGIYAAGFNGSNYNNNISNYYYIFIRKNQSTQSYTYNGKSNNPTWVHLSGQTFFTMAAGDYIDFYSAHDSGGTDKGGFDVQQYTTFYVEKVR
tara:strand:- start:556 stop:1575 length:1020 start_codon:yes stop_codon:yes gene_type:complete